MIKIIKLTESYLKENIESIKKTLENLKWYKKIEDNTIYDIYRKIIKNNNIIIAINEVWEILWIATLIIEYKLIRWGSKAWRIEDIWVRKKYEWKWIWKKLLEEAIKYLKKEWVYKITLTASEKVEWFYLKNWFQKSSSNFKMYI